MTVRFILGAAILLELAFFLPSCTKKPQQATLVTSLDTSIRKVNWDSLLAHDKVHFEYDSIASEFRATYRVVPDSDQGGSLDTTDFHIKYLDFNKDGREDAIITLFSGGSGAYATAVLFFQTPNGPKYVGCAGGPHYIDSLFGDTLDIITAHWLREEAQCCWGAEDHQRIIGIRDSVRFLSLITEPEKGRAWEAVDEFYKAVDGADNYRFGGMFITNYKSPKEYAYSMLSDSYKASHPYVEWLKGYATMQSVKADVDQNLPDTDVSVKITSVDKINGRMVTKHFAGVWHTKFITNNHPDGDSTAVADWFLDWPEIREVK